MNEIEDSFLLKRNLKQEASNKEQVERARKSVGSRTWNECEKCGPFTHEIMGVTSTMKHLMCIKCGQRKDVKYLIKLDE